MANNIEEAYAEYYSKPSTDTLTYLLEELRQEDLSYYVFTTSKELNNNKT